MTFNNWIAAVNTELERTYCISIRDSGYTDSEFYKRFGQQRPEAAVQEYAEKFDLYRWEWNQ